MNAERERMAMAGVRLAPAERRALERSAARNGRTLSGELRFALRPYIARVNRSESRKPDHPGRMPDPT